MANAALQRVPISRLRTTISIITSFLFGLALASAFFLWHAIHTIDTPAPPGASFGLAPLSPSVKTGRGMGITVAGSDGAVVKPSDSYVTVPTFLSGLRILVTIASFDFMQLAHLEEVLDGFQDTCYAGSKVDIVIYTTVVVSSNIIL